MPIALLKNRRFLAATLASAVFIGARLTPADTISVHSLSENTSTGVYTYSIQLDAAADIQTGDGFVIYDFPDVTSATITGNLATSQFTLVQSLTSNSLSQSASVDSIADAADVADGLTFDSPSVENLSFEYIGPPVPFLGAGSAVLTLTTSDRGGITDSVSGSVDHSGVSQAHPFSFSATPVEVPLPTPEPASLLLLALGLPLISQRRKQRG
jgi:hypothetical protein